MRDRDATMTTLLDEFRVILLDMNGTFMFGEDRFGPNEYFYEAYRALGGNALSPDEVDSSIRDCHQSLWKLYENPARYDDFPSVAERIRRFGGAPEAELPLLEQVFAAHELGSIPPEYATLLRRLSQTHRLGLVTNIWSRKGTWLAEFARAGVANVFACEIFSSDTRSIKPSPALFRQALQSFPRETKILFIGDSLQRDMLPAKALGLTTVWVSSAIDHPSCVDHKLGSLLEIDKTFLDFRGRFAKLAP
jgi:putative hydrolase of the HAD superfamily